MVRIFKKDKTIYGNEKVDMVFEHIGRKQWH